MFTKTLLAYLKDQDTNCHPQFKKYILKVDYFTCNKTAPEHMGVRHMDTGYLGIQHIGTGTYGYTDTWVHGQLVCFFGGRNQCIHSLHVNYVWLIGQYIIRKSTEIQRKNIFSYFHDSVEPFPMLTSLGLQTEEP